MNELKVILGAVDFSPCSVRALQCAGRLASQTGAVLHLIHVIDSDACDGLASAVPFGRDELEEQLTDQARTRLKKVAHETLGSVSAELIVQIGHPLDAILTTMKQVGADVLVMGAYGDGGSGRGAGTLATKCARRCAADVLLVHETQADPMRTVIACVDFSPYTEDVVATAARVAAIDGAHLVLLHVHHNPFDGLRIGVPIAGTADRYREYVATLEGQLDRIRDRLRGVHGSLRIDGSLLFGVDYGRSIVAHAKELEADLVVLGAKGKTNLSYVLLGSTPEKVLRETNASVMTVRLPTRDPSKESRD